MGSCNSCNWSMSSLTPEQYSEMMPSLLGPDCYQVTTTPQHQVIISLCQPKQESKQPGVAPVAPVMPKLEPPAAEKAPISHPAQQSAGTVFAANQTNNVKPEQPSQNLGPATEK